MECSPKFCSGGELKLTARTGRLKPDFRGEAAPRWGHEWGREWADKRAWKDRDDDRGDDRGKDHGEDRGEGRGKGSRQRQVVEREEQDRLKPRRSPKCARACAQRTARRGAFQVPSARRQPPLWVSIQRLQREAAIPVPTAVISPFPSICTRDARWTFARDGPRRADRHCDDGLVGGPRRAARLEKW